MKRTRLIPIQTDRPVFTTCGKRVSGLKPEGKLRLRGHVKDPATGRFIRRNLIWDLRGQPLAPADNTYYLSNHQVLTLF